MKFLLVALNAKYIHSNPGLYSLKAYAGNEFDIQICEYTINNRTEEILSDIYRRKPDAIGFSCYIWNITPIKSLLKDLVKLLPETDFFLGGPEVAFCAEEYFAEFPWLKGVFTGEGEIPFKEVMLRYKDSSSLKTDLSGIPDLYTGTDTQQPLCNTSDCNTLNLDYLPFIYENGFSDFENRIIYYESSRGCPFRCSYCLSSLEKKTRFRSLDKVYKELGFFLENKVKQVKFIDRTFNCDKKRTADILRYILEHDNGITNFHFEIAADLLDEEVISLLCKMRPGLVQLEIGVQSTNTDTLKAINRVTDINRIRDVVSSLRSGNNLHLHLDLIAGLPYEDFKSFRDSFNDVFNMRPTVLQLGFLKVLKGSPVASQIEEHRIKFTSDPPYEVLSTAYISYDEICLLKDIAEIVEIYFNSSQFTMSLPYIMSTFDTPFDMFEALATYYRSNNLFVVTPARSKRYDVLISFASSYPSLNPDMCRRLMLMDFCLREKPKSMPAFASGIEQNFTVDYNVKDPVTGNFRLKE